MEIMFTDKLILATIIFALSLGVAAYATWAERKLAAWFQDRIGPNRAGPFGLLQPIADGVKLFMKEEIIPADSDKFLFIVGPSLFMLTALMTSAVIPWSTPLNLGDGHLFQMQVADINIGILYVFAVVSIGVYGIMIGGWASNNKYSLLGALRASSQMISYELAMGLSIVAIIMMTGAGGMSIRNIVESQSGGLYGVEVLKGLDWNIFYQPLGFMIFIVCAFAECNRTPFDLPEAEAELGGGYHIEYSSMKLGLFLFAEYVNMFISSAVMASLYFGGYNFPGLSLLPEFWQSIAGVGVFMGKITFFIFVFMWVRWTVPRFRYDQLMTLGWKILLPLSILNIVLTGTVMLFFSK
ncbi:MAG TPA: NADH-quinone oxidoreductase subunit NuoH [Cytophagaceae bacterium]|nr:NADH-quinone oxidoreductase subunit NuoH [Cytophagaceae bacterium]